MNKIMYNIKEHITEMKQQELANYEFTQSDYNLDEELNSIESLITGELLSIDEEDLYET